MAKNKASEEKKLFKYTPADFGKLPVKVEHFDLDFDIYEDHIFVKSKMKSTALESISKLDLDAKDLEFKSVECDKAKVKWSFDKDAFKLKLVFDKPIKKGDSFIISSDHIVRPTKHILEGMYFDETPKGAPPTMITQCQQWGFQRLVPCIDDMTAKCTYITSITADARYTNIITNGDLAQARKAVAKGRDKIVYDNTKTPMAPYLFFLGVGTYDTFTKEVEYPDGDKFMVEFLVIKGSDAEVARKAVQILHDGILWVYLYTGPDMYKNRPVAQKVQALLEQLDAEKSKPKPDAAKLSKTRADLKKLSKGVVFGYKYTGTVYREIAMQNSDFGGMENVGNTTITANRIMPYPDMSDGGFEYMIRVKVHEYYHNINGSEVTGWSPFEIWLNEAVTVHVELWHHAFLWGEGYSRLESFLGLISPDGGTYAKDAGAASMPVEPNGFNDPNELITSITYVKAPEFVRMIETLIGKEKFALGLHNYHTKYAHSNATSTQWLEEMEKVSGLKLKDMAAGWLKKQKYPIVEAKSSYDDKKKVFTLNLVQTNASEKDAWQFPFKFALLDPDGKVLYESIEWVQKKKHDIVVKNVPKPSIVSLNRGSSFYGKVDYKQSKEDLVLQLKMDADPVAKYMAFYKIADAEKTALLLDPKREVSPEFIDLYYNLITDEKLIPEYGTAMAVIFESVEDERFAHKYELLYLVKKKIQRAVARKYKKEFLAMYEKYSRPVNEPNYLRRSVMEVKNRQVKISALRLLARLDDKEVHAMIKKQFFEARSATDRNAALSIYLESSAPDKIKLAEEYSKKAAENLVRWESFLAIIGSSDAENVIELIKWAQELKQFRIEQSNDQRALYATFASNKRISLLTREGREFLTHLILKLGPINEYTTGHLLRVMGQIDLLDKEYRAECAKILVDTLKGVDKEKFPSVYNTAKRMLVNLPVSRKEYEAKYGKISDLVE
jgi:aminopeptidase N